MKTSPIRRIRILLNAAIIVAVAVIGYRFFLKWQQEKVVASIVETCQLPPLPETATVHHSFYDTPEMGPHFVAFSISTSEEEMDQWLEQVDQWQLKRPKIILSYSLRESKSSSRIDFNAEISTSEEEHLIATKD